MKFTVPLLLLVAISHAAEAKKSKSKSQTDSNKTDKRDLIEGYGYGDSSSSYFRQVIRELNPGIDFEDPKEELAERSLPHHVYSPSRIAKISDLLTEHDAPFHSGIASHLYSPTYHPKYEASASKSPHLAYSESHQDNHESRQDNQRPQKSHSTQSKKKQKKKQKTQSKQSKHHHEPSSHDHNEPSSHHYDEPNSDHYDEPTNHHYDEPTNHHYDEPTHHHYDEPTHHHYEEPTHHHYDEPTHHHYDGPSSHHHHEPKEFSFVPSYPHLEHSYGHDIFSRPHHLFREGEVLAPRYYPEAPHLVRPVVSPLVRPVIAPQIYPQFAYQPHHAVLNPALQYAPNGYAQPVQYIQQQSVEEVIPHGVTYAQQAQEQIRQESQQIGLSNAQHEQQTRITAQHAAVPQPIINLQSPQSQGAVSYASFSQSLPGQYGLSYTPLQNQPPQGGPPGYVNQYYQTPYQVQPQQPNLQLIPVPQPQPLLQPQPSPQPLPQLSGQPQLQQELPRLEPLQNFQSTPQPTPLTQSSPELQHLSPLHPLAPIVPSPSRFIPLNPFQQSQNGPETLRTEQSQTNIQIEPPQPSHQQAIEPQNSLQTQSTIHPQSTIQSTLPTQPTPSPQQLVTIHPNSVTVTEPVQQPQHSQQQPEQQQPAKEETPETTITASKEEGYLKISPDQPQVYSEQVVIQQSGQGVAPTLPNVQHFSNLDESIFGGYIHTR